MENIFSREEIMIGKEGLEILQQAKVIVLGIGGVGSFAAEALARAGIGHLILVDHDVVDMTNINRQLLATQRTVGKIKVEVMQERILDINPDINIEIIPQFISEDNIKEIIPNDCDYIVDAIDTISAKINLIEYAYHSKIPIISAMGAGNKLDPTQFNVADISQTSVCPLARIIRKELRKKRIEKGVEVVYSKELPIQGKHQVPGSISFVPSTAGLVCAAVVVNRLLNQPI